jgi:serine/threonine protein kinase
MSAFSTTLSAFCTGNIGLPQVLAVLRDDLQRDRQALFDDTTLIESAWRSGRIDQTAYAALRNTIVGNDEVVIPDSNADAQDWPPIRASRDDWHADDADPINHVDRTLLRAPTGPRGGNTGANHSSGGSWSAPRTGSSSTDSPQWSNEPAKDVSVGMVLKERFVLEELIGRGGMGTVYKAKDLRKEEAQDRSPYVAVKVLNEDFRRHPESLKALQREAKKAQSLAHPNVATVYDFDRDGPVVFLVMELLEGQSLETLIKNRAGRGVPRTETLRIVRSVGAALAYAHHKGMVHSDFKPANAFRTHDGTIKVFDFGIARAIARPSHINAEATKFDVSGLGALTPAYASCEMLIGEQPHPSDDVFALACVTYELLTGRHPFGHLSALLAERRRLKPIPIAGLDRRGWRALTHGLAFSRKERTASIEEFLAELTPKRHIAVLTAACAAGVAAVGIGAWMYFPGQRMNDLGIAQTQAPVPAPAAIEVSPMSAPPAPPPMIDPVEPAPAPTAAIVVTPTAVEAAAPTLDPVDPAPSVQAAPAPRQFSLEQLKQRLVAFARSDEVPDALALWRELQGRLKPDDEFLRNDAPQAIGQAYFRLGERAFTAGNYSAAVALLDRAHEIAPEFPLFTGRREQMARAASLEQMLQSASELSAEAIQGVLSEIEETEGPRFQMIRSQLAETMARRIRSLQQSAPVQANQLLSMGQLLFVGTAAMEALAPVDDIKAIAKEDTAALDSAEPSRVVTASP